MPGWNLNCELCGANVPVSQLDMIAYRLPPEHPEFISTEDDDRVLNVRFSFYHRNTRRCMWMSRIKQENSITAKFWRKYYGLQCEPSEK